MSTSAPSPAPAPPATCAATPAALDGGRRCCCCCCCGVESEKAQGARRSTKASSSPLSKGSNLASSSSGTCVLLWGVVAIGRRHWRGVCGCGGGGGGGPATARTCGGLGMGSWCWRLGSEAERCCLFPPYPFPRGPHCRTGQGHHFMRLQASNPQPCLNAPGQTAVQYCAPSPPRPPAPA